MSEQWGSHWRWRLALLVVTGLLLGYGWTLAEQWKTRLAVSGGAPPAVVRVVHRDHQTLEAYDWANGKQWTIAEIGAEDRHWDPTQIVCGGKSVAWQTIAEPGIVLHVMDIAPPANRRSYGIPIDPDAVGLVGISTDERFAVFLTWGYRVPDGAGGTKVTLDRTWRGTNPMVYVHYVVDLKTEKIVDTRECESRLRAIGTSGEFASARVSTTPFDPMEPTAARWRITSEGSWELIAETTPLPAPADVVSVARDGQGTWRFFDDDEVARGNETSSQARVLRVSPSGEQIAVLELTTQRVLVGNVKDKLLVAIDTPYGLFSSADFPSDGYTLVLTDMCDDVRVVDTRTGRTIAREASGSTRRNRLLGVSICLVAMSLMCFWNALRESSVAWGITDAMAANVVVQLAAAGVYAAFFHREFSVSLMQLSARINMLMSEVMGSLLGTAVLVGWYWGHGTGWLPTRWLFGTACFSAMAVACAFGWQTAGDEFASAWTASLITQLILAGVSAALVAACRSVGLTIRDAPTAKNPGRFGLATFFIVITGISILIALGRTHMEQQLQNTATPFLFILLTYYAVAIGLVAILFVRARWYVVAIAAASLLAAAMIGLYWQIESLVIPVPRQLFHWLNLGGIAGTVIGVTVPCVVLRSRGWRWVRATRTAVVVENLQTTQSETT